MRVDDSLDGQRILRRRVGMLAGCVHATMYEIAQYSWLAEDEIFLCALVTAAVACFVHIEFSRGESLEPGSRSFVGHRTRRLAALFVLLGLTNLAKGLLFGTVMSLVPIGAFLLGTRDPRRILFYFWLPGWALFALIAAAWPFAAWLRFPDVTQVWWYDHGGRLDGHYADITQPWYYYLKLLPTIIAPWIALVPWSAAVTWRKAWEDRSSAERFVWGWAILVPLVFSIPTGKHHHYMLHAVAPWSILTAFGLARLYAVLQTGPAWLRNPWPALGTIGIPVAAALWLTRHKTGLSTEHLVLLSLAAPLFGVLLAWGLTQSRPRLAGGFLFGLVASGFLFGHVAAGKWFDQSRQDAVFLAQVREYVGADKTSSSTGRHGRSTNSASSFRKPTAPRWCTTSRSCATPAFRLMKCWYSPGRGMPKRCRSTGHPRSSCRASGPGGKRARKTVGRCSVWRFTPAWNASWPPASASPRCRLCSGPMGRFCLRRPRDQRSGGNPRTGRRPGRREYAVGRGRSGHQRRRVLRSARCDRLETGRAGSSPDPHSHSRWRPGSPVVDGLEPVRKPLTPARRPCIGGLLNKRNRVFG